MRDPREQLGAMYGPHESVDHFLARTEAQRQAPTWAQLREQTNHADRAYEFLASAPFHGGDAEMAKVMVDAARVHSELAIQDKLGELVATIREIGSQSIETNAELSGTIKKATNHVVAELRKATVKAAESEVA